MTSLHDLVHRNPTIKGLRGCKGPNVMRFNLDQVQGLLACLFVTSRIVCFNQEERVAGLMSKVCPFLKEIESRDQNPVRSLRTFSC